MTEISIRHYQPSDQTGVFEISAETAFFGEPVEAFLEDRRLYWDAFARYYIEQETPFVWVAESSQGLIGFLLGCADTSTHERLWRSYILTKVLITALRGRYRLGRQTANFTFGMLLGMIRGEDPKTDLNAYPAHLQIDVRQGFRGKGVGRQLINAYLGQLGQMGISGVHLETTSQNEIACHLYEKIGFQLIDSRTNRYWSKWFGHIVENRSYGLKLA